MDSYTAGMVAFAGAGALAIVLTIAIALRRFSDRRVMPLMICGRCGELGLPVRAGSDLTAVVLFLAGLIPGLLYMLWRQGAERRCPSCGGRDMLPIDSPRGSELKIKYHSRQPS